MNNGSNNHIHQEQQQRSPKLSRVIRKQKLSILNFPCENLRVSHINMEQGFNKHSILGLQFINRHTILNTCTIILALSCIFLEISKLPKVLENSKNIEILKRDFEALQRQLHDGSTDIWTDDDARVNDDDDYNVYDDADDNDDDNDDDDDDDDKDYGGYESHLHDIIDVKQTLGEMKSEVSLANRLPVNESAAKVYHGIGGFVPQNDLLNTNMQRNETESVSPALASDRSNGSIRKEIERDLITNSSHLHPERDVSHYEPSSDLSSPNHMISSNIQSFHFSQLERDRKNDDDHQSNTHKLTTRKKRAVRMRRESHMVPEDTKKISTSKISGKRNCRSVRQIFAAHYGADSSLSTSEDEHTGNGRFRHHEGIFKAWRPSDWMGDFGMDRYFSLHSDGKMTVHETGLYLIYAQIHYLDEHDENGFHLLVNGRSILQCMVYSPGHGHKSRSCFSAQVIVLQSEDRIILKDVGTSRYTLFQREKSFFGLVRIGDIKHPQVHTPKLMETEG